MIRDLTIDDYEPLYALWLSCTGMGLNDVDDSREGIAALLERNPGTCLCYEEEGRLLGAILIGTDGRRGYVYHAAVHPSAQRRGIGRALVEAALERVRALGIRKLALVAFAHNEGGNAFWERMGFYTRDDLVYKNFAFYGANEINT